MTKHGFFTQIRNYMYSTIVTEKLERLRRSYRDHWHDYQACSLSWFFSILNQVKHWREWTWQQKIMWSWNISRYQNKYHFSKNKMMGILFLTSRKH